MWPPAAPGRSRRGATACARVSYSRDRGEGVLDELLELGGEPVARRDVEPGYGVGWVGVPVPVGIGAVRVAVPVTMAVGGGGVVAVGLTRGLDPHVGVQMGERGVGVRLRERAEASAVLVAPVAPERPPVDLGLVHEGVEVGGGAGPGGSAGAAPAVARAVDQH